MTKIENFSDIVRFCEQKKQTGDIQTLSRMFGFTTDAIRMRLSRKNEETFMALYEIVQNRERLIQKYQNQH